MTTIAFETGPGAYAPKAGQLTDLHFGARYIGFRNVDRFREQTDALDPGLIVWPGGALAETRPDRFGLEFDGLSDPTDNAPEITEMMALAREEDAALSIIVPTLRYRGDPERLTTDLDAFLGRLFGGDYGALPKQLILEVGSEYYAHFPEATAASDYALLAEAAVASIAAAETDPAVNTIGANVTIAVQAGKGVADGDIIRAGLSDDAQSAIDLLVHHRFSVLANGGDSNIPELEQVLAGWEADAAAQGDAPPDLSLAAWNVASLTRIEARNAYLDANPDLSQADIDLDGRTTTAFETYWQDRLDSYAYGPKHAPAVLEIFHSYAEMGADMTAIYGTDVMHPSRTSWMDEDRVHQIFAGGEMYQMLRESVVGTTPLAADPYDPAAPATLYGFENDDKLILFIAAGDAPPGEIEVELDGLGDLYRSFRLESLTAEIRDDWMTAYAIPDNPDVDETPEAWTFADPVRTAPDGTFTGDGIRLPLATPHEVVRLSLAKTPAGEAEIADFSGDATAQMMVMADDPSDGVALDPSVMDAMAEALDDAGDDGTAVGALLLLPFLFFAV